MRRWIADLALFVFTVSLGLSMAIIPANFAFYQQRPATAWPMDFLFALTIFLPYLTVTGALRSTVLYRLRNRETGRVSYLQYVIASLAAGLAFCWFTFGAEVPPVRVILEQTAVLGASVSVGGLVSPVTKL